MRLQSRKNVQRCTRAVDCNCPKKTDAPWIAETMADCAVALDMLAPHASLIQIWQNSDRGAGALLNGIGIEEFTNSLASRHNASLVIVSDILEVPTW
jgi:hypothetical protein